MMNNIVFENPGYFHLLWGLIPMIAWYVWKQNDINAKIRFSSLHDFESIPPSYKYYLRHILFVLRLVALTALVVILARPQSTDSWQNEHTEGIDIMMAIDVSSSMLARDFKPDRLEAAKDVAVEFISGRPNDRMGLVIFSGESFTQCPLTTDHPVLINLFNDVKSGMIEDGTAIGLGLATSVTRLKDSKAISKVIILLTDGVNNQGEIAPLTAAEIAKTYGIRVYTVGVGTMGQAPYPVQTPFGTQMQNMDVKIDEEVLREIAGLTGGKYFRATDNSKLKDIYKEIDKLEKSKIEVKEYSKKEEEYFVFALIAVGAVLLEILLKHTIFRSIP